MPEQTDPTRELVRRAYADVSYTSDLDTDGGLADVVRRSGRPRQDEEVIALEPRRGRGRFAVVGTFAAAVVTILAVYAASAGTGAPQGVGAPTASASASASPSASASAAASASASPASASPASASSSSEAVVGPNTLLPSSCAAAWTLTLTGGEFTIAARSQATCPPLRPDRVWVLDAASGNGRISPGDAVIWPVAGMAAVRPPLTFRPREWPGPVPGHAYELLYLDAKSAAAAKPGDDAYAAYEHALTISTYVIA